MPDDLANAQTWIVMLRDVSSTVSVKGEPVLMASLVLDTATGLAIGVRVATDGREAIAEALRTALTDPPDALPGEVPGLVLCSAGLAAGVEEALARHLPRDAIPPVRETDPVAGAEDVFDSLLAYLAGRAQPEQLPAPADWAVAYEAAERFWVQAPWNRWTEVMHLQLELETPEGPADYVCIVLGAEGGQAGLALRRGRVLSSQPSGLDPEDPAPPPVGSLALVLDEPSEMPADLMAKAVRYGWPRDGELVPAFMTMGLDGPAEAGHLHVQHLSAAAAAVVAHDQRGPIAVGPTSATAGELTLPDGRRIAFRLAVSTGQANSGDSTDQTTDEIIGGSLGRRAPARAAAAPAGAPAAGTATATKTTIDTLFADFLATQRERLAPRTYRNYQSIIELFADCLNGYGHLSLNPDERVRWEAAYAHDEEAFVHLFGVDKIVDNLGEFLGYFMIRKVLAGEELLRSAGTVTKKLSVWLGKGGHLNATDARMIADRGTDAARDLPRAEKLSRLLYEHSLHSTFDVESLDDSDYVNDYLTIDRVEPGRLWFIGGIGPLGVPEATSALAKPGWSLSISLARRKGRWYVIEVGNVYP